MFHNDKPPFDPYAPYRDVRRDEHPYRRCPYRLSPLMDGSNISTEDIALLLAEAQARDATRRVPSPLTLGLLALQAQRQRPPHQQRPARLAPGDHDAERERNHLARLPRHRPLPHDREPRYAYKVDYRYDTALGESAADYDPDQPNGDAAEPEPETEMAAAWRRRTELKRKHQQRDERRYAEL